MYTKVVTKVGIQELRKTLGALLDRVAEGEEVVITRRGKEVAKLVPAGLEPKVLPDLSAFRASLSLKGEPMSKTVIEMRRKSRY